MDKDKLIDLALHADDLQVRDLNVSGGRLELKLSARLDKQALAAQLLDILGPEIYQAMRWQLASGKLPEAEVTADNTNANIEPVEENSRYGEPAGNIEWQALMGGEEPVEDGVSLCDAEPCSKTTREVNINTAPDLSSGNENKSTHDAPPATGASDKPVSMQRDASVHKMGKPMAGNAAPFVDDEAAIDDTPPEIETLKAPVLSGNNNLLDSELVAKSDLSEPARQEAATRQSAEKKKKLKVTCPKCSTVIQHEVSRAGTVVTCRKCGKALRLATTVKNKA